MDIQKLQKEIVQIMHIYAEKHEVEMDTDFGVKKLAEEFGEYVQATLIHQKKCKKEKRLSEAESKKLIAHELADIIGLALFNAHLFNIDVQQAMEEKWLQYNKK